MERQLRRNRIQQKQTPQSSIEETAALLDLLFQATSENSTQCSRLLGIARPTWKRWSQHPPTEWYWPLVLRAAIKHTLSQIISQRRATSAKFRSHILESLSKVPHSKDFEVDIANLAYEARGAELHLRTLLVRRGMWWSEIQKTANSGGYSKATLRKAAKSIGVVKRQEGYGDEKDSFWRLPNEDED